ncbi:hypothetical protein ACFPEL_05325 [Actinomycetospora chibensis]|uniref:Uncharacterized protein n=1 Tax=Actinomycetospora chibensis TaxID=663606 RepID=A0ABV9RDK8_9PSEU|nr:hypothetical protein [Actinomycetospora chibensis]MDD7927168.1 hypothetical protein [Actinomycetospora chibensis]
MVAVGALAVCAVAGGAVVTTRSAGPPEASPGPADDATSESAGSSAWTREATSVLTAIETELDRTDEVRRRWDTSSVARRDGPPPRAVVALLGRQSTLTEHRDALRSAMTAIRSGSAREAAMATAWQQLRAAQEMLRALDAGRSALGDPVEATVLRLALDQDTSAAFAGGPPSEGAKRATTPRTFEDAATVAAATTTTVRESSVAATSSAAGGSGAVGVAGEQPTPDAPATGAVPDDAFRPGTPDGVTAASAAETADPDSLGFAAAPDQGTSVEDDDVPTENVPTENVPTENVPTSQGSSSPDPVRSIPSEPTMLTFDRSSSGAPDPESVGEEKAPLASDPDPDPDPDPEPEAEGPASRSS